MRYVRELSTRVLIASFCIAGFATDGHAEFNFQLRGGYVPSGNHTLSFLETSFFSSSTLKYHFSYTAIPLGATLTYSFPVDYGQPSLFVDVFHQHSSGKSESHDISQPSGFTNNENILRLGINENDQGIVYVGYKSFEGVTNGLQEPLPSNIKIKGFSVLVGARLTAQVSHGEIDIEVACSANKRGELAGGFIDQIAVGYAYSFSKHFSLGAGYKWEGNSYELSSPITTYSGPFSLFDTSITSLSTKLSEAAITATVGF